MSLIHIAEHTGPSLLESRRPSSQWIVEVCRKTQGHQPYHSSIKLSDLNVEGMRAQGGEERMPLLHGALTKLHWKATLSLLW